MEVQPGQLTLLSLSLGGGNMGRTVGIIGGLGAAGVVAALALGGGGPPTNGNGPTTGAITFFFPNP